MRIDRDYIFFIDHFDWYTVEQGKGYVPTPSAPKEAVEAIQRFNENEEKRHRLGYMD